MIEFIIGMNEHTGLQGKILALKGKYLVLQLLLRGWKALRELTKTRNTCKSQTEMEPLVSVAGYVYLRKLNPASANI